MSKVTRPDPVAFARVTQANRGGRNCTMCRHPEVNDAMLKWAPMWTDGSTSMSYEQAAGWLAEALSFKISGSAVRHCAIYHHGVKRRG